LKALAGANGLDQAAFNQCLDSGRNEARVRAQTEEGRIRGVTGTPSFLINGIRVEGAQPYEVFRQAIEQALAAAGVRR
jgi:predicted DsbA family dithiol-disulfide isomerase